MGGATPNIAGFIEAQQRLRSSFGEVVWFLHPASVTFPPGTNIDPSTGQPFDPAIAPTASATPSASAQCDVFFRAISRGGTGHEVSQTASDMRNQTLLMLITDYSNRDLCKAGERVILRGETYKIMAQKPDGIGGVQRWLVYVKEI